MPEPPEPPGLPEQPDEESKTKATTQVLTLARPSDVLPEQIRDVSFGFAIGGYSRGQVDAYVEEVKRVVAELEVRRSPDNAVKVALDRVGEQTSAILQQAREAAEALTASELAESEHAVRRARVEAEELMETAQSESRALLERSAEEAEEILSGARQELNQIRGKIEAAKSEQRQVLAELRSTATALEEFAAGARERKPDAPPGSSDVEPEAAAPQTDVIREVEDSPEHPARPPRAPRPGKQQPRGAVEPGGH